jgi:hypothetical protein
MLPLIFFVPIFARETCVGVICFLVLSQNRSMVVEYIKQRQSAEDLDS